MPDEAISTIGATLRATAKRFPDRVYWTDGKDKMTFAELDRQVDAVCESLLGLGLKRHDRVAVWLPNGREWPLLAFACARLGMLVISINTRYKASETKYILQKSRAKALFMKREFYGIDYRALLAEIGPEESLPELQKIIEVESGLDGHRVSAAERAAAEALVSVEDPAFTVFTSGTTGYPKGAVHAHIIQKNMHNIARALHIESGDIVLGHMPFYHVAGLFSQMLLSAMLGCTLLTVAHWEPVTVAKLIAEHRVNIFGGIPTHFIDIADVIEKHGLDTSCLKSAWIGGATVTPEIAMRAKNTTRVQALQCVYGMTETSATTTLSPFEDPIDVVCENKGKTVGNFEVRVVDPETGTPRQTGENGEIWVRGHLVMQGYLDDPEETAKVMTKDGFFKTGDIGRFDDAGYLQITGRMKDMFIVGGTNAYPAEIERFLLGIPGVRQAVVVGVPDYRLGEVGFAFIQREDGSALTAEELVTAARKGLADYKVPRRVEFVTEFPMTTTNKIQRGALAKQAAALVKRV